MFEMLWGLWGFGDLDWRFSTFLTLVISRSRTRVWLENPLRGDTTVGSCPAENGRDEEISAAWGANE
jgi:hypothetical protein